MTVTWLTYTLAQVRTLLTLGSVDLTASRMREWQNLSLNGR